MKILIVKTSSLGDIIQAFPALDYLHRKFPQAQIDWVVEKAFAELIRAHPQVDRVLTIESKKWRKNPFQKQIRRELGEFRQQLQSIEYDLVFDLQGNLKSSSVLMQVHAQKKIGFGWKSVPEWPNTLFTSNRINPPQGQNIRDDYLSIVKSAFKDLDPFEPNSVLLKLQPTQEQMLASLFTHPIQPTLVCGSAAWQNKCLPLEKLIQVLQKINRDPYWFVWGSVQERKQALYLSSHFQNSTVLPRLSLPLLQHVMARSQLVVAMDSLPLHLCGTTQTSSLSFFGPSSSRKYRPLGSHHLSIQGTCPYHVQFEKRCPKLRTCKTGKCMDIDPRACL